MKLTIRKVYEILIDNRHKDLFIAIEGAKTTVIFINSYATIKISENRAMQALEFLDTGDYLTRDEISKAQKLLISEIVPIASFESTQRGINNLA